MTKTKGKGNKMKKHESTTQKGLFFWAEPIGMNTTGFMVIGQAEGYPATEAFDDWLSNEKDADEIAEKLSKGEL